MKQSGSLAWSPWILTVNYYCALYEAVFLYYSDLQTDMHEAPQIVWVITLGRVTMTLRQSLVL